MTWGLPSCRGHKKEKHKSSKFGVIKPGLVIPPTSTKQPFVQIFDVDSSNPPEIASSKPPKSALMNLLKNEDLALERFQQAVTKEDVAVCYDMSVKNFDHSIVHDLFKVFSLS